ncbi:sperm surface protein Sp17 [Pyxicephalus adspersus]|uniref:sperm surface protein Sp17 n=1 Tax=Pyxicephalus adspersus TaxID=30357 RepID=UPI003B5CFD12
MAIPFSNTNYRIPRGFANLLEGLTREVLREQPKDIPLFAAKYFSDLLRNREESGFDPAEWGASLEDRFYNNKSFQHTEENVFTPRSEGVSRIKESITGVEIPQSLEVSLEEEQKNEMQEVPSEEQHKDEAQEVPPEEEHKVLTQDDPSEEEEPKLKQQDVPSEEEHQVQAPEVPSEEKVQTQEVPLEEEEHKLQQQDVPSEEEEPKIQPQDISPSTQLSEEGKHKETEGSLQDQAATVIQAAVRGHLVRHGAKQLREEEAGNKLNISEPPASDVTSTTQDEDQETARTDVDSATHPELQRVGSAAMLQDISDPEESHEGPTHVTSDSVLQEQHESEQEDRLQVEKEEAEDNEVTSEAMTGDDGVQAADNGDEMSPEHPEAVEPSYSRTEPGADLGTKPQIHDGEQNEEPEALTVTAEQNVQDDSDHIHETTEEEDRNDQTAETAEQHIAEDITEQTAEQSDVVDMAEATGHSNVEDSNDHITETTKLPEIEDSNGATEATDREETGEQKKEINEDQPASAPIPEEESPGGEVMSIKL